jgi:hypothetical protein
VWGRTREGKRVGPIDTQKEHAAIEEGRVNDVVGREWKRTLFIEIALINSEGNGMQSKHGVA